MIELAFSCFHPRRNNFGMGLPGVFESQVNTVQRVAYFALKGATSRSRGILPKKLGRGVRPAFQNPYPIYDQNLRFSLSYL